MAYQKQTWEDLPSTNTPITASRLNHIEDGIEEAYEHGGGGETLPIGSEIDYDGENIPTGWEEVDNPESYSTTEVLTNKTWINGEPIYRKVIEFSRSNHDLFTFNISSSTIVDKFVLIDAYVYGNNNLQHGLYRVDSSDQFRYYINGKNQINVEVGSTFPNTPFTGYFIIEYTKTGGNS